MAIDGMKVIDLDSHLVGDLESWDQTVEAKYKELLPRKLPTKDNERRKTLISNRIMIGSELGRQKADKKEWVTEADLTPHGRLRARAQNNYMNWYASQQQGRLMWAGVIPLQDTKEAIKELHRSRGLGSKALNV